MANRLHKLSGDQAGVLCARKWFSEVFRAKFAFINRAQTRTKELASASIAMLNDNYFSGATSGALFFL
jgi:hypothetical protein